MARDVGWHDRGDHSVRSEAQMAIKVIVELTAHPGRRDELRAAFERMLTEHGSDVPGFLGSSRYERFDDPDVLVEIADWESAEAREAHMKHAADAGTYAPLLDLVAAPFKVTVLSALT
jgi:quinol monooxygenase YgiN